MLIEKGCDVSLRNNSNKTALHYLVRFNECVPTNIIEYLHFLKIFSLVVHCVDINDTSSEGDTILHECSIYCKNPHVIELILKFGGNPCAVNNKGLSPLQVAILCENFEHILVFLRNGAKTNDEIYQLAKQYKAPEHIMLKIEESCFNIYDVFF